MSTPHPDYPARPQSEMDMQSADGTWMRYATLPAKDGERQRWIAEDGTKWAWVETGLLTADFVRVQ